MICPNCGNENNDGSNFCKWCGASLPQPEQPQTEQTQTEQQNTEPQQTEPQQTEPQNEPQTEQQPAGEPAGEAKQGLLKTRTGKILLIVIIACAVACALIAVFWIRSKNRSQNMMSEAEAYLASETLEDISYDVGDLSVAQKNMLAPMGALIYYDSDRADGSAASHSWAADGADWSAVYELINGWSISFVEASDEAYYDGNYLVASSDLVKECASALYADFDGQLPSAPALSEGGLSTVFVDGDNYYFALSDRGEDSGTFSIDAWTEHGDGSNTVEVQEYDSNKETLYATYSFDLVDDTYTESSDVAIYTYSVSNMTQLYLYTPSGTTFEGDYVLPESDSRYYTADELKDLTKDELRLARNEIYARHGRKFDDAELQSYFNSKDWYEGTINPNDFKESTLNQYEKANVEVIQSLE